METATPTSTSTGAKPWLFLAVIYGVPMGVLFSWQSHHWIAGVVGGLVAGVLFATAIRWFVGRQAKRFSVDRPDLDGDAVLLEGPANHFKGAEGVGGYLWLTSNQLCYRSHRFNIQNHECRLPLAEIATAEATRTLGLISNGLLVRLSSGAQERFVVYNNRDWVAAILNARSAQEEG